MKEQNFKNHLRFSPTFHFISVPLCLLLLAGSIYNLVITTDENRLQAGLIVLIALLLASCLAHSRIFALRVQDRAIRAEENLRHYQLTGKPLNKDLRLGQVIALRFAPDNEFPQLAEKTIRENLRQREIKKAISQWKADHYRV